MNTRLRNLFFQLLIILMICKTAAFGQESPVFDSLLIEMCQTVQNNQELEYQNIWNLIYDNHIQSYLENAKPTNEVELLLKIDLRLQKNCEQYLAIISKEYDKQDEWGRHDSMPKLKIDENQCDSFFEEKEFQYLETNGDIVNLSIDKGFWIDNFKDGSYSKLKFFRTDECAFKIEFVESNNYLRKNFSEKGDTYFYQIFDFKLDAFLIAVKVEENNSYYSFKMYKK